MGDAWRERRSHTPPMRALLLAFALTAAAPSALGAQTPSATGGSAWGIVGWGKGVGIGARYMVPMFRRSFLDPAGGVTDRLAVEFGADALSVETDLGFHTYRENELRPTLGALWLLQLDPHWSIYPKLDLGYSIGWTSGWDDRWGRGPDGPNHLVVDVAAGVFYKLGGASIRAELGSMGLKLGAGFGF